MWLYFWHSTRQLFLVLSPSTWQHYRFSTSNESRRNLWQNSIAGSWIYNFMSTVSRWGCCHQSHPWSQTHLQTCCNGKWKGRSAQNFSFRICQAIALNWKQSFQLPISKCPAEFSASNLNILVTLLSPPVSTCLHMFLTSRLTLMTATPLFLII